jgi:hypothetical protein
MLKVLFSYNPSHWTSSSPPKATATRHSAPSTEHFWRQRLGLPGALNLLPVYPTRTFKEAHIMANGSWMRRRRRKEEEESRKEEKSCRVCMKREQER